MMFTIITLFLFCLPIIWWHSFLQKYRSLEVIPGPKPLPIIGNVYDVGNTPQDFYNSCLKFLKQHGDLFKIYIGNECKVFIANADFMEEIMNSNVHITKSRGYSIFKPFLHLGLLTSTGSKWKTRRKMITPTFHFKILNKFLEVFNSAGNILVEKISKEVDRDSTDLYTYINLFSLDVICETAMGVKISSQDGQGAIYVDAIRRYFDIVIIRFFSPWKKFDCLFKFASEYPLQEHFLHILHDFSSGIIKKRRAARGQKKLERMESEIGDKQKIALLDMLLENEYNNSLTNADVKEEINTFMFEGHDTSTSGICFALLTLANHPDVQSKVCDEIMKVVGQETYVTMDQLQEMKYLDMVIKEVQRLYPAVPLVERQLETDANISGVHFPRGTTLTLYLYGIHHNEKYFPYPDRFEPDRFLPEKQSKRHHYAFVPFSAGPRNCIGQKFAMLLMKTTIVKILQRFELIPIPNYKPDLGMSGILKSYNGIFVRLKHR